jgi:inorganic pyrophosphatase
MRAHPWHDVEIGADAPQSINAIIEISRGSKAKYEVDKASGLLRLDRVLYTSFYYPINYGFIPRTYAGDGDPLDILVLSQVDIEPLTIVQAKVIGVLRMIDKGADDKIIAVCANDAAVNHYNDIKDLPPHFTEELKHFFMRYKDLEVADVSINNFGDAALAYDIVTTAISDYQRDILPTLVKS